MRKIRLILAYLFFAGILAGCKSTTNLTDTAGKEQNEQIVPVCISFYNVENLFDTIDDPDRNDTGFTPDGRNNWDTEKYNEKIDHLAEVISLIGLDYTPDGAAILGVSEIENEAVLLDLVAHEKLIDRNYQVVYHRGSDRRVDNALLYNPSYFDLTATDHIKVTMEDRPDFRTRDHVLVSGDLLGEKFHFIVAHWPSRRGGERRSRPNRIAAAKSARLIVDSLRSISDNHKIMVMGDFNDDPTDASVAEYLYTTGDTTQLTDSLLYNPYVSIHEKGIGTLAYRDKWNLFDQLVFTTNLFHNNDSEMQFHTAGVFKERFMIQSSGRYQGYPFRSLAGGVYLGGYSDHFPAYVILLKNLN